MDATILSETSKSIESNTTTGYLIGIVIAVFILAYLLYSLIKPEKF
jgi:K+-transporting ATPase KdpF subunit